MAQKGEMGGRGGQVGRAGVWDGPGRGMGTWENNSGEYIRVGDGAGSMGVAIESIKKAK